jgi:exosome complex exonuclease DIS3/RRP44
MNGNEVQHAFYKRTRRGNVIKIVREQYLRSDIGYGYLKGHSISEKDLLVLVADAPHKTILVIDTNVALHQIDVLEHTCPATSLVVVLQTVMQEVKNLNVSVYRRLLTLIKDEVRSFIFFPNELSSDTVVLR